MHVATNNTLVLSTKGSRKVPQLKESLHKIRRNFLWLEIATVRHSSRITVKNRQTYFCLWLHMHVNRIRCLFPIMKCGQKFTQPVRNFACSRFSLCTSQSEPASHPPIHPPRPMASRVTGAAAVRAPTSPFRRWLAIRQAVRPYTSSKSE